MRKEVPFNEKGTDYVIGDLHGAYDLFKDLLEAINFDPEKDRMFSVGDLVDRGPKSLDCARLLFEDWFHPVLANHEEMMMHAFNLDEEWANQRFAMAWLGNGGTWGREAMYAVMRDKKHLYNDEHYEIAQIANKIKDLPYVINVPTKTGYVHILHAELPPIQDCHITTDIMRSDEELLKLYDQSFDSYERTRSFTWGRYRFVTFHRRPLVGENIDLIRTQALYNTKFLPTSDDLIISGHTVVTAPVKYGNFLNIDTGAVYALPENNFGLTCYNITDGTLLTVHADRIAKQVSPFIF